MTTLVTSYYLNSPLEQTHTIYKKQNYYMNIYIYIYISNK